MAWINSHHLTKRFLFYRDGIAHTSFISIVATISTHMNENISKVADFHVAFNIENNPAPTLLSEKDFLLRFELIREENEEYLEACRKGDIIEIADALGDILYIAFGTILRHGLQDKMQAIFDEIQRSNMSKLDEHGKPIYREDGKVLKGANYTRPDIASILAERR